MTGAAPDPIPTQASAFWLLAGLALPPGAWIAEMLLGVGIASNACPLTNGSGRSGGFAGESTLLVILTLLCLALAAGSGLMSWRHWLTAKAQAGEGGQSPSDLATERSRFLSVAGMLTAATFTVAILFSLLEPIVIPACWSAR
jgi:hypothetical protein